jgi:uncharacterized NAD(P)/FAD-binding protein YdhS
VLRIEKFWRLLTVSPKRCIVIVGGGFSGTVVASNLLSSQHWADTHVVLIERAQNIARGKAYADREHPYLLNVPAGRMSAKPHLPLDFLNFVQHRIPDATADDFLPRTLYGQYLEATLLAAEVAAATHVRFDRLRGEVCAVEPVGGGSTLSVKLADGRELIADDVVLALGNPSPAPFPGSEALRDSPPVAHDSSPRYVADPWDAPLRFQRGESVLLIGTGLTMADITLTAAATSNGQATIHSISRHGLLPPSQTAFSNVPCAGEAAALLRAASFSALTLLRSVRELVQETESCGGDWREAVTFIRNMLPALWERLPLRERRRMLRHVRPYWDVHRHRLPNETFLKLKHLRQQQKLHIHAGRIASFESVGEQVRVTWRPRGAQELRTLTVDRVVNCTGPDFDVQRSHDPLLRSLLSQGLVVSDTLKLGLRTGANGALIDSQGRLANNLFYVGPMLRADHWEATAAQELRGHAERLANYLAAPIGRIPAVQTA